MQVWGPIVLHPMAFPIADQTMSFLVGGCKYLLIMYGAVLKPTVEDFQFLFNHLN